MKTEIQESNRVLTFADFVKLSDIFIETGTCFGRSVHSALVAGYNRVKSVEAKEDFYEYCRREFAGWPQVELFLGKSIDHLAAMLEDIDRPAVLWLDAHVSGERSAGYHDYLEKGEGSDYHQHTALKKELSIVLAHRTDHIILIDDQNGPNADNEVYIDMIQKANPDYRFYWIDEQCGEVFYKNKILAAMPKDIVLTVAGWRSKKAS